MSDIKICDICGRRLPVTNEEKFYTISMDSRDYNGEYCEPTEVFDLCQDDFGRLYGTFKRAKMFSDSRHMDV